MIPRDIFHIGSNMICLYFLGRSVGRRSPWKVGVLPLLYCHACPLRPCLEWIAFRANLATTRCFRSHNCRCNALRVQFPQCDTADCSLQFLSKLGCRSLIVFFQLFSQTVADENGERTGIAFDVHLTGMPLRQPTLRQMELWLPKWCPGTSQANLQRHDEADSKSTILREAPKA